MNIDIWFPGITNRQSVTIFVLIVLVGWLVDLGMVWIFADTLAQLDLIECRQILGIDE